MNIDVTVDDKGVPSCDPYTGKQPKGKAKITWKLRTPGWVFTGLVGLPDPPFSNLEVKPNTITIDDDNPGGTEAKDYPYTISVSNDEGKPLASGNAVIRNEPN